MRQTALFDPRGLLGLLSWVVLLPAHAIIFRGMLRRIRAARNRLRPPEAARRTSSKLRFAADRSCRPTYLWTEHSHTPRRLTIRIDLASHAAA